MVGHKLGISVALAVIGVVGGIILYKNSKKIQPTAAKVVAKGIKLKEKGSKYVAKAKEQVDEIVAEAKLINEKQNQVKN